MSRAGVAVVSKGNRKEEGRIYPFLYSKTPACLSMGFNLFTLFQELLQVKQTCDLRNCFELKRDLEGMTHECKRKPKLITFTQRFLEISFTEFIVLANR